MKDIRGISGRGYSNSDVSRTSERFKLPGEDLLKSIIIPYGCDTGSVYGQCQRRQCRTIKGKTPHKFRRDVLRVRGAATIAEQ